MTEIPSVDVVVVNWNTAAAAVASAEAYLRSEGVRVRVTIADNRSVESERELLLHDCPAGAAIVLHDRNLGYGAAANAALVDAGADLVCVSNADLLPAPAMLRMLADVALAQPRAGLVAPALGDAYHVRLPRPAWLVLKPLAGRAGVRAERPARPGEVLDVEQPAGACLVVRMAVWRELGGFDPAFFLWFEDVDLARRSRDAGYRNLVVGDAAASHQGAAAFMQVAPEVGRYLRLESLERYARKHHPRLASAVGLVTRLALRLRGARCGAAGADELRRG